MKEELLAALSTSYAQLERRLETAANPRDPKVRTEIAAAAFELLLASSSSAAELEWDPLESTCRHASLSIL